MNGIYKEKTKYGNVLVADTAIHKLVESTIEKHKGKVFLTNSRGKRINKVYRSMRGDQGSDVQVYNQNGKTVICVYLIIKFGLSIKDTTDKLMEELREAYNHAIGENPWKIKIVITGVFSKKLAKRNVEVEKTYDK